MTTMAGMAMDMDTVMDTGDQPLNQQGHGHGQPQQPLQSPQQQQQQQQQQHGYQDQSQAQAGPGPSTMMAMASAASAQNNAHATTISNGYQSSDLQLQSQAQAQAQAQAQEQSHPQQQQHQHQQQQHAGPTPAAPPPPPGGLSMMMMNNTNSINGGGNNVRPHPFGSSSSSIISPGTGTGAGPSPSLTGTGTGTGGGGGGGNQLGNSVGSAASNGGGAGGGISALSALMRNGGGPSGGQGGGSGNINISGSVGSNGYPAQPQNSPTFPSQLSPYSQPFNLPYGSFGGMGMSLTNPGGTGASYLGPGSMMMGMSISPQYAAALSVMGSSIQHSHGGVGQGHLVGGSGYQNFGSLQGGGGYSLTNHNPPIGAERSRELEAKFVKDFTCCGLRLNGLHDLLEHYEDCHVHLAPELKKQSINLAKQEAAEQQPSADRPPASFPSAAPSPFNAHAPVPPPQFAGLSSVMPPSLTKQPSPTDSEAPGTPGVMELDMMDDDDMESETPLRVLPSILPPTSAQWSSYQNPNNTVPQCVPPSLLSYAIPSNSTAPPNMSGFGFPGGDRKGTTGGAGGGSHGFLTEEQKAERAARKAARKEAKRVARENGQESSDDGRDADGFKKYRCPVEGCNKSYKQANGLKYHLNRSINSSHGKMTQMLPSYLFKSDKE